MIVYLARGLYWSPSELLNLPLESLLRWQSTLDQMIAETERAARD